MWTVTYDFAEETTMTLLKPLVQAKLTALAALPMVNGITPYSQPTITTIFDGTNFVAVLVYNLYVTS